MSTTIAKRIDGRVLTTPYADLMPPLSSDERTALEAGIKANGVLQPPLITEDGEVLDGHNRLSIEPNAPVTVVVGSEKWSDDQKRAFVVKCNMERRNLSPDQRKDVLRQQKKVAERLAADGRTQAEIGEMFGVGQPAVSKWFRKKGTDIPGNNGSVSEDISPDEQHRVPRIRLRHHGEIADRVNAAKYGDQTADRIAADYHVSPRWIRQISNKENRRRENVAAEVRAAAGVWTNVIYYQRRNNYAADWRPPLKLIQLM